MADAIRELMQDRKYAEAIKAIEAAATQKDAPVDYLTWLKGRALSLDGEVGRGDRRLRARREAVSQEPLGPPGAVRRRCALAKKGDFRAAELIYRGRGGVSAVDGPEAGDRRFVPGVRRRVFKPPKEDQKPDYAKALEFYQKALEVGPKPEKQIEVELLVAECQQSLGKLDEAAGLYEKFDKEHGDSPLDVEARFRLGQSRLAQGRSQGRPPGVAGPAGQVPGLEVGADSRSGVRAFADVGDPAGGKRGVGRCPNSTSNRGPESAGAATAAGPAWSPGGSAASARPAGHGRELSLGVAALDAFIERFPAHKLASRAHLDIAASLHGPRPLRGRGDGVQAVPGQPALQGP